MNADDCPTVVLTLAEQNMAAATRLHWLAFNAGAKSKRQHGESDDPRVDAKRTESGLRGEIAVAKWLGKFWSPRLGGYRDPDIGAHIQVRTVERRTDRLILHDEDRDDHVVVLVDGTDMPLMRLCGWVTADEGRRLAGSKRDYAPNVGRPCYWLDRALLHDLPAPSHVMWTDRPREPPPLTEIIPATPGWNDGPEPPPEERPPAWDDMSRIERALFVYRWRLDRGLAPNTGDAFADAGFKSKVFRPREG